MAHVRACELEGLDEGSARYVFLCGRVRRKGITSRKRKMGEGEERRGKRARGSLRAVQDNNETPFSNLRGCATIKSSKLI